MTTPLDGLGGAPIGLGVFFAIGLLGGAHCLGMCGPLVATYATRMGGEPDRLRWREVRQHALFNTGRTISYAAVGVVMGALGAVLFDAAGVVAIADGVRGVAGVLVGGFILAIGAQYALRGTAGGADGLPGAGGLFARVSGALTGRIDAWAGGPRIVGLGAVHALLPCPILYPAYLYAFARGSPIEGALALAAVGLGTFPTLFAFGTVIGSVATRTRVRIHRALGVVFLVLGLVALSHGLRLLGAPVPHIPLPVYQPLN